MNSPLQAGNWLHAIALEAHGGRRSRRQIRAYPGSERFWPGLGRKTQSAPDDVGGVAQVLSLPSVIALGQ